MPLAFAHSLPALIQSRRTLNWRRDRLNRLYSGAHLRRYLLPLPLRKTLTVVLPLDSIGAAWGPMKVIYVYLTLLQLIKMC